MPPHPVLPKGGRSITSFEFRGRTVRPDPLERDRFRGRLRSALRVGHGLGVRFRLVWESGPDPRVEMLVNEPTSVRWVRGLLSPAFEAGEWVERRVEEPPRTGHDIRVASPALSERVPFPSGREAMPWGDTAVAALSLLPPGIRVEWEARPSGTAGEPGEPHPRPTWEAVPPGFRPRTLSEPERELQDASALRGWASTWGVRGELRLVDSDLDPEVAELAGQVLARVGRRDGGNELRFRRTRWLLGTRPPWFLLSEEEIGGLIPSQWARVGWFDPTRSPGAFPLWVGAEGRPGSVPVLIEPGGGRHMSILGETGMGKSSLMVRLALQAIRHGAVVLFDPMGDTAERFLAGVPDASLDRVTLLSPERAPIALNALAAVPDVAELATGAHERVIGEMVNGLRRVRAQRFSDTPFWGPRIEETVTLALRLAASFPGGTLETAHELLVGGERVTRVVPEVAKAAAAELRRRVEERPEEIDGARRLLGEVARNPILRRMLCSASPRWSLEEAIRPGRVTVISGAAPQVGELAARYLLAIDLALLWSAAVGRTNPTKVFVFLDEAQWFAHESAAEMLRMGRRFNVHVVLATQSLSSLPESLREAVLTNAAEFVLFRGAPSEAREFSRWVPDLPVERVQTLGRGEAAVLVEKGRAIRWVRVAPARPLAPLEGRVAEVARRSMERFGPSEEQRSTPTVRPCPPPGAREGEARRAILLTLAAGAAQCERGSTLRVYLRTLREVCDPPGAVVRELGAEFQRSGVLLRAGRDPRGAYWELTLSGWPGRIAPTGSDRENDEAATRWLRVAEG